MDEAVADLLGHFMTRVNSEDTKSDSVCVVLAHAWKRGLSDEQVGALVRLMLGMRDDYGQALGDVMYQDAVWHGR